MASVNYLLEIVEEKQIVEIVEDGEALSQQVFIVETGPIEVIEIVDRGLQGDKGDPGVASYDKALAATPAFTGTEDEYHNAITSLLESGGTGLTAIDGNTHGIEIVTNDIREVPYSTLPAA